MTAAGGRVLSLPAPAWTPNGHCRHCGVELTGRKRVWCSEPCSLAFWAHYSWGACQQFVFHRDGHRCQICGRTAREIPARGRRRLEVDHIVPIAEGGASLDPNNCRVLCYLCHQAETAKLRARLSWPNRRRRLQEEAETQYLLGVAHLLAERASRLLMPRLL